MVRVFVALTALALLGCSLPGMRSLKNPEEWKSFNSKSGFDLAVTQDSLLERYGRGEAIADTELPALRNNQWIRVAKHIAPSNLILRQWGLADLISGTPSNASKILEMVELLAPDSLGSGGRLWVEGYSYWLYTRAVLAPWTRAFDGEAEGKQVRAIMNAVDSCFTMTAYSRNGILYPAPFGDLRDQPLADSIMLLHAARPLGAQSCSFLTVNPVPNGYDYRIAARPVGLNTHIPADTQNVEVRNGTPLGFKFYEGYDKKYADALEERLDMLRPERVGSIQRLGLKNRFKD